MSQSKTTPVVLTFTSLEGAAQPLGSGQIDETGQIVLDAPAPGQEAFAAEILDELNAREDVILKEPPSDEDGPRFGITKRSVLREDPEFLSALITYAQRLYSLTLEFDLAAIAPPPPDMPEAVEATDYGSGEDEEDLPLTADDLELVGEDDDDEDA